MAAENIEEFDYSLLSPQEIIDRRLEINRLETIPLSQVRIEDSLTDQSHVDDLAVSMSQKRGQIMPIGVRAVREGDQILYDIFDGFHRSAAKKQAGLATVDAKVVYGCRDDELYDLRVLAASSVRSVQFPRIAAWMQSSYATTAWSERGLSVVQAFTLAQTDRQSSYLAGLSSEELAQVKDWVRQKCSLWGKSVVSALGILQVAVNADPGLLKVVRNSSGGKDRGFVTPTRLSAVVNAFPGQDNHPIQRVVMSYVTEQRLSAEETKALTRQLQAKVQEGLPEEDFQTFMSGLDLSSAETVEVEDLSPAVQLEQKEARVVESPAVSDDSWDYEPSAEDLDAIAQALEIANDDALHKIMPQIHSRLRVVRPGADSPDTTSRPMAYTEDRDYAGGSSNDIATLKERNQDLQQALEEAVKNNGRDQTYWWQTAPYLTPTERITMERVMTDFVDIQAWAKSNNRTPNQVIQYIVSAYQKRFIREIPAALMWSKRRLNND